MKVLAYLRASTKEQDAERALDALNEFAAEKGFGIDRYYIETVSGAQIARPELSKLITDAERGDVLLVEKMDRLSRLEFSEWEALKATIKDRGLNIVVLDLPTSHAVFSDHEDKTIAGIIVSLINGLMLDLAATMARDDYETRRRRQAEGLAKAKAAGKMNGRPANPETASKCAEAMRMVEHLNYSKQKAAETVGVGIATLYRYIKEQSI